MPGEGEREREEVEEFPGDGKTNVPRIPPRLGVSRPPLIESNDFPSSFHNVVRELTPRVQCRVCGNGGYSENGLFRELGVMSKQQRKSVWKFGFYRAYYQLQAEADTPIGRRKVGWRPSCVANTARFRKKLVAHARGDRILLRAQRTISREAGRYTHSRSCPNYFAPFQDPVRTHSRR